MRLTIPLATLICALLFVSACTLALDPELMPDELAPTQTPEPLVLATADDVPRITVDAAKEHLDNGTAFFVDSRTAGEYERAHIVGAAHAYSLSADMIEQAQAADQLIITYCT